jgi:pectate lyase
VLGQAGATLPRRDAVDRRVIEMVRTGKPTISTALSRNPDQVGGYPELAFSPDQLPADTDADGMPDDVGAQHNLNPNDPKDATRRHRQRRIHQRGRIYQRHESDSVH